MIDTAKKWIGYLEHADGKMLGVYDENVGKGGYTIFAWLIRRHYPWRDFSGIAWCATFVHAVCIEAFGVEKARLMLGKPHPGTRVLARRLRRRKMLRDKTYRPKAGDIIFLSNFNNEEIGHVGIVVDTDEKMVYSVEGNTIDPSGVFEREDGGAVALRGREFSNPAIVCYGEIHKGSDMYE